MVYNHISDTYQIDGDFILRTGNMLQVLACLSHLARVHGDDPSLVQSYASQAEEAVLVMGKRMHSACI
jgi:hypothetical protein